MKMSDMGKYAILYDLPEGDYGEREVGGIRTRTIRAGDSLEVEAFPILRLSDGARREAKRRASTPAQQKLNLENARKRMRRMLEANFTAADLVLHPTIDYGFLDRGFANITDERRAWEEMGYPMDDDAARRMIKNLIARLKRRYVRNGGKAADFKYLYVIESTREPRDGDFNAMPPRYHFHMVVSGGGHLSIEDVNDAWQYGYAKAQALDMRYNGLEGLAKYITKQRRFTRRWACSRNLKPPEEKTSDRRISRRRAALVAADVQAYGREIFEKIYPGYRLEEARVRYSDFAAGAYIYARMRRYVSKPKKGGMRA